MTRKLLCVLAVALAAAGAAGADTFRVLPSDARLLSAATPNLQSAVSLPTLLLQPPAQPAQLSFAQLSDLWQRAGAAYGIPWQVLGAINKIESNFGQNMGPSSAGAIGWMQFMPDTWLRWGTDANGDGIADPWSPEDAVYSAARYLAASGGRSDIARAVFAYNHAQWYVDEVLQLAQVYAGGVQVAVDLNDLQVRVQAARDAVVAAQDALAAAQAAEQRASDDENALLAQVQAARMLSDQLTLQQAAAQADGDRAQAHALVEQRQAELAQAQTALDSAQSSARAASFDPGARTLLSGADYAGNYVFPVGGGPGLVSVSHVHHDYPAADIAAPEGSPAYALANGVVTNAWTGDPRCGTGFTIQTEDRQTWTYCHLAVLDPAVAAGAGLVAGTQVGLVGHTGDATGPHLHLQLQPATAYPQDEPWFQDFAGSAFTWQDDGTGSSGNLSQGTAAPGPVTGQVFAVVPTSPQTTPQTAPRTAPQTAGGGVVLFTR
ncbi:MAG TPA: lytic murein transglycosylase [Gaiellaceae bacterium]|nr:lytic murein transglycosylase [Gaiellaceae bacterium]